uniref:Uncharacterized protein n=1 Tax=Setaria italica TaxID=4555 RepID=K3XTS5_SETIT
MGIFLFPNIKAACCGTGLPKTLWLPSEDSSLRTVPGSQSREHANGGRWTPFR